MGVIVTAIGCCPVARGDFLDTGVTALARPIRSTGELSRNGMLPDCPRLNPSRSSNAGVPYRYTTYDASILIFRLCRSRWTTFQATPLLRVGVSEFL